ncbi:MAG: uroporphyrinogen-III C-methyltransferase [Gammaproteobacteria bacterium]|nr:uroporphyrinogen-III C-methyltransferase [Gammaproteobacteria bacterium]NIM72601.1 uroporphyrinogen-III C-methyltransferase [Gammaproteobacteria bacterium]NIN37658.1 uroporphyrinogen-III C-methyltransferase [Gammaproteobacteria bacterium]NIO24362.1 uroporphyrinogen-III C-methyltransferase [Gammaproteobacteria bacterium]NIO64965.1 uroporphyrinogen-III C-methyltransferase [Gammaproteobacteria bacterium]
MSEKVGKVFLVGAGPGDPELLTIKARRLLEEADVLVYDRLVSEAVLELVPAGVLKIFVGKAPGNHPAPQDTINDMLVRLARAGHRVVRLKGGDPFVFGRGGEEALHLVRHGIAYEVVPGVTAALACAAYAGIPLTHRGLASSLRFVAGHCRGDLPLDLDWRGLADEDTTLVFYMALANLGEVRNRLLAAGLPGSTPAAVVESGTTERQRAIDTTLEALVRAARSQRVGTPAVVIIGRVAALAAELAWYAPHGGPEPEALSRDASAYG